MKTLTLPEVCSKLSISSATVYRRLDPNKSNKYYDKEFPRPKEMGLRRVVWLESEVDAYLIQRPSTIPSNERSKNMAEIQKQKKKQEKKGD